ncbi:lysine-specific demethylase 4A-like isoform X2 [Centruroides vittatus]|uniref:lysine-specific demethylase 4A-like isoform X1 n=1 Tax=Centruroides vittatus TaxID=120091 RepID=UPI00351041F8
MSYPNVTSSGIPRIMVFQPNLEEMKDFPKYIEYMESKGAHKAGLAKIIPPKEWCPRRSGYDDIELVIPAPISQVVTGRQGMYQQYNIQKKAMTVQEFKKLAESERYATPPHFDYDDLERKYWKNITYNSPIYGADISGSLYDEDVEDFNINHLNTILDLVNKKYGIRIEGVNTAYLYFGMWKTTFAWHTEDMDLYSINYLHFGAPKSWYAIPPEHGRRLERLAAGFFPGSYQACSAFLRHKMTLISPQVLKQYSIPFNKITQEPGEFMITFPYGYHAGYNHGFNCAESTNFGMPRWIEYGKRSLQCMCRKDCVKISMDVFVRTFQPDRYEMWKQGKDIGSHPEYPSRCSAAPPPVKIESDEKDGRRKYKTEAIANTTVSKRHPISHIQNKKEKKGSKQKCESEIDQEKEKQKTKLDNDINLKPKRKKRLKLDKCKTNADKVKEKKHKKKLNETGRPKKVKCSSSLLGKSNSLQKFPKSRDISKFKTVSDMWLCEKSILNKLNSSEVKCNTSSHDNKNTKSSVMEFRLGNLIDKEIQNSFINSNGNSVNYSESSTLQDTVKKLQLHLSNGKSVPYVANTIANTNSVSKTNLIKTDVSTVNYSSQSYMPQTVLSFHQYAKLSQTQFCNTVVPEETKNKHQKSMILLPFGIVNSSDNSSPVILTTSNANKEVAISVLTQSQKNVNSVLNSSDSVFTNQSKVPLLHHTKTVSMESSQFISQQPVPFLSQSSSMAQVIKSLLEKKLEVPHSQNCSRPNSPTLSEYTMKNRETVIVKNPQALPQLLHNYTLPTSKIHLEEKNVVELDIINKKELENNSNLKKKKVFGKKRNSIRSNSQAIKTEELNDQMPFVLEKKNLDEWAKPVFDLWQCQQHNFKAEKNFNSHCSNVEPHCSICIVFKALRFKEDELNTASELHVPSQSPVWMPSMCFDANYETPDFFDKNLLLETDGTSPLYICTNCKVCVHATCYGITAESDSSSWKCARCTSNAIDAECCLCVLRGGALKPTTNGQWAHVLCAILIPDVSFVDIVKKEPVDISKVTRARQKLKCSYCHKMFSNFNLVNGICIQCSAGKCSLSFHVTCGYMAGVTFETCDWPVPVYITCTRHTANKEKMYNRNLSEVQIEDKVIAKHKNGRYYHCEVIDKYVQDFYSVDFEDSSYSDNLLPEDIKSRDCLTLGPPPINETVQVLWTDGKIYNGLFKGVQTHVMHQIEFEDGSEVTLKRQDFYSLKEDLPKKVKSRLSEATEVQHKSIFEEETVGGKRLRVSNSKYKSDSILPL